MATSGPTFQLRGLTYTYPQPGRLAALPVVGWAASLWQRLRQGYGEGNGQPALVDVTADIYPGVTAVLGLSGSGKTTLLNTLGLLADAQVSPGQVVYAGTDGALYDYADLRGDKRVRRRRTDFGFVLQSAFLLPHFSCLENVAVPLALAGLPRAERLQRAEQLFLAADPTKKLFERRHSKPRDVSGGERQRVAVLRAVVHDPRVLFADEPLSNLDPANTRQILRLLVKWLAGTLHEKQDAARDVEDELLLQKWLDGSLQPDGRKDRTLLLVSHTIPMTVRFAHGRCLVIRNGKLVRGPDRPLHDETEATHEMGGTDDLGVSAGVRVP